MSEKTEPHDDSPEQPVQAAVGKVKEALGWATADRRVEAEGAIDQLAAEDADEGAEAGVDEEEVLDEAELHVRNDHGDLAPHAEPDDQPVEAEPKVGG